MTNITSYNVTQHYTKYKNFNQFNIIKYYAKTIPK